MFNKILADDPKWAKDNYYSWAQGFMAGSNSERIHNKQPSVIVNSISEDEKWEKLKGYCKDHPDRSFLEGVLVLFLSLPTKPHVGE